MQAASAHRVQNNNVWPLETMILGPNNIVSKGKSLSFCTLCSARDASDDGRFGSINSSLGRGGLKGASESRAATPALSPMAATAVTPTQLNFSSSSGTGSAGPEVGLTLGSYSADSAVFSPALGVKAQRPYSSSSATETDIAVIAPDAALHSSGPPIKINVSTASKDIDTIGEGLDPRRLRARHRHRMVKIEGKTTGVGGSSRSGRARALAAQVHLPSKCFHLQGVRVLVPALGSTVQPSSSPVAGPAMRSISETERSQSGGFSPQMRSVTTGDQQDQRDEGDQANAQNHAAAPHSAATIVSEKTEVCLVCGMSMRRGSLANVRTCASIEQCFWLAGA